MWVIDPTNIAFEELCDDFKIYNDMIVTQVVHLSMRRRVCITLRIWIMNMFD